MPGFGFDPIKFNIFGGQSQQTQEWRKKATPEELESWTQSAKNIGATSMGYALSALDKPGRATRGLLAGKPRELGNLIPFSDTLGITDPNQATSGAELNKKYLGIRDDNSWKSWGAGLATELLADPLNLVGGFGAKALTKTGLETAKLGALPASRMARVHGFAKTAGKSAEDIAHMGRQGLHIAPAGIKEATPLTGLIRFNPPFMPDKGFTLGAGTKAAELMAKGGDMVGKAAMKIPGAKTARSMFSEPVKRSVMKEGQEAQLAIDPARKAAESEVRYRHAGISAELERLTQEGAAAGKWDEPAVARAIRMSAEGQIPSKVLPVHPELWRAVQPLSDQLREFARVTPRSERLLGLPSRDLVDRYADHFRRQLATKTPGSAAAKGGQAFPTGITSNIKRKRGLKDTPGGTAGWNVLSVDPKIARAGKKSGSKRAADKVLDFYLEHTGMPRPHTQEMDKLAKRSARRLKRYDPTQGPMFNQDIAADYALRAGQNVSASHHAQALYRALGLSAQPIQPGMVPLSKIFSGIKGNPKLQPYRLRTYVGPGDLPHGALVETHKALARQGMAPTEPFLRGIHAPISAATTPLEEAKAIMQAKRQLRKAVDAYGVTPEQAQKLMEDYGNWRSAPRELGGPFDAIRGLTQAFRGLAYGVWPASHVRNLTSGKVQTLTQSLPHDAASLRLAQGTTTPADLALYGAKDAQDLKNQYAAYAKGYSGINPNEVASSTTKPKGIFQPPPGQEPFLGPGEAALGFAKGWGELGKGLGKAAITPQTYRHPIKSLFGPGGPLQQAGVLGATENFPLLAHGHKVGTQIEDHLRAAQFLGERAAGANPLAAGQKTLATHFDYSGGLAPFERNVMRNLVPFYTYSRFNLPLHLRNATQNPRSIMPQLRLAASRGDNYVPQYLASGAAIPLGQEDENGQQRFISQLGLPAEEAFERLKVTPGDPGATLRDTILAYAGGLNPLIKGPLEQLSNTQFFSGRKLSDLRPQGAVGGIAGLFDPEQQHPVIQQVVSQALANTPATRFISSLDKLLDPRKPAWAKALNLGTGVRISDVDIEKSKAIESRKTLEKIMQYNPNISQHVSFYVKPEDQAKLNPEAIGQLQKYSLMQANAQEAAKKRRQEQFRDLRPY